MVSLEVFLQAILLPIIYIIAEAYSAWKKGEAFRPVEFVASVVIILISAGVVSTLLGNIILNLLELEMIVDGITLAFAFVVDKLKNAILRQYPLPLRTEPST